MAWNGAGVFSRLYSWVTDAANGVDIDATRMDADTDDITTGLNNCLTKDGQNTPTTNLPMGGYKHTGVADGSARNHYASVGQLQDASVVFCTAGGTANALTLAYSPVITALTDGMELRFRASATCAAGSTTAAVNGIAAKAIKRSDGTDPLAGDITNGRDYTLRYNLSGTTFTLLNSAVAAATESVAGITEIATQTETDTGTDDGRAITPLKLETRLAGSAVRQGLHTIWVPAVAMVPRTTNGAAAGAVETTTNKVMLRSLDFDTAASEYAQFAIRMPKSWNEGTVTAKFTWSHASTTTNFGVVWGLQGVALSDDDAADTAFGTAQTAADTGGTTNDIYISPTTSAITIAGSPAAEDWVVFQVYRAVSDGSDTMAVDARLLGVTLYYTVNAATDA